MSPVRFHPRHFCAPLLAPGLAVVVALNCGLSIPNAFAQGINLSWDDCGAAGTEIKSFACNLNTGQEFVVASFQPPAGMSEFLGVSAEIRLAGNTLPDWWRFGACRPITDLSISFDFTAQTTSCVDPWLGVAAGGFAYDIEYYSPNTARFRIQGALPFEDRKPLALGTEYSAFRVRIPHSKSTGTGSCAGCAEPLMLRLESLQLFQPPELANDPVLTVPILRNRAYWQSVVGTEPQITAVSPAAGTPGTPVTISGTALIGTTAVRFGGVNAAFTVNSDVQVSTSVPLDGRSGAVEVMTPFGTTSSPSSFTVGPRIDDFLPKQGPSGSAVQVYGLNFNGTSVVAFNGMAATFSVMSDSVLQATVPAGATSGPIAITNAGGSAQSSESFQVGPAEGLLNMSWNDCGLAGSVLQTFACNTNSGPLFTMVGSFVPPSGVNELLGMTADIRISAGTLPDWWKHGAGECRGSGSISANMNFQTGPFSCADFWQGFAATNLAYDVDFYGPNAARLRVTGMVPAARRGPVDPHTEYYAFRANFSRLRTVGDGSCAGCDQPVALSLEQIQLLQPAAVGNDPIITRPYHRNTANWQGTPGDPPIITSIAPVAGAPGIPVTLEGAHFTGVTSVRFQTAEASFTALSDTVIIATVPPDARTGPVIARSVNGTAVGPVFTVAPRIVSFGPRQAPIGYNPITIRGFNFTSASAVTFNGVPSTFTVPSDSVIRATVPAGATNGPLSVTGPGGSTVSDSTFRVGVLPPGGMNLSWDNCGLLGGEFKSFACNANTGSAANLIGSFTPPPFVDEFVGINAILRIESFTTLPDWWKHGAGQCRGTTGLSATFNFVGGPSGCTDVFAGQATGSSTYDIGYFGPNTARLVVLGSRPAEFRGPVSPDDQYNAFRVSVLATQVTGSGSCAGCATPVQISLESLQLFQPAALGFDPIIVSPIDRTVAYWQAVPGEPPTVESITPTAGPVGTAVTIRGDRFVGVTSVRFADLEAAFSVPSDSVILTTVPAGARTGPVSVRTVNGIGVGGTFTVAPRILTFVPRQAPIGFSPIVIRGFNFAGATAVLFNGVAATFTVPSDSVIQATVPVGTTNGPISVVGPGGSTPSDSTFRVGPLPAGGMNLSWDNCGVLGPEIRSFACNVNTGSNALIGSFVPPPFVDEFVGMAAEVRVEGFTSLPDWWKHGVGQCRGTSSLTSSFNFSAMPGCFDPFADLATGSHTYTVGYFGPNTARIQIMASKPAAARTPVLPDREYYAFRLSVSSSMSTGAGSCAGCATPVRVALQSLQLFQPAVVGYDPILVSAQDRAAAYWQAAPGPVPDIQAFAPTAGVVGTPVTLTGHYFTGASAVRFGGVASGFSVPSDSVIQTTVPAGGRTGSITVSTIQGTGSSAAAFTVAPDITTFSPRQAPVGYVVRIHGNNFTGATQVLFNGLAASFTVDSDLLIRAPVPTGATSGPITVVNAASSDVSDIDFTVGPLPGGFVNLAWDDCGTAGAPIKLFACNTNSGPSFALQGSFVPPGGVHELIGMTADLRIASAGTLPDWWRHGATQCRGTTGLTTSFAQPAGACLDPWLGDAVGNSSYEIGFGGPNMARMVIWCFADSPRPVVDGDEYYAFRVNIQPAKSTGSGSCAGCGTSTSITLRQIQLHQSPALKDDPLINTPLDSKVVYWQSIPGEAPEILTISPTAGEVGTPVTITGHRFTGTNSVRFNSGEAGFNVQSDSVITTSVPSDGRTGPIYVTTANGIGASGTAFIVAPDILSFSPTVGPIGSSVTIAGINFTATSSVSFNGVAATFVVLSDTEIRATVPETTDGPITVVNPGGSDVSDQIFRIGVISSGGINLSWNECGDAGTSNQVFACNSSAGSNTIVASFAPGDALPEWLGTSADMRIEFAGTPAVPDWWQHGTGLCRGTTGLSTNYDFTSGPFTCLDVTFGQAAGGFAYDVGFGAPNRARLRVQYAIPFENRGPLDPGVEYYAYKVILLRSKTTGTGSCQGCSVPTCIQLNSLQLFQPPEFNNDPTIFDPLVRNSVSWQGGTLNCPGGGTPVLVSVVTAEATSERVRLIWQTEDVDRATVHRREGEGAWRELATLYPDGQQRVTYEDTDVRPGATYDYRLGVPVPTGEIYMGETQVTVPSVAPQRLALARIAWDGSAGALAVSLSLPQAGSASLELFDINGRRLIGEHLEGLSAGTHELQIRPGQPLKPGVFFGRVTQNGEGASRRFVVVQ